MYVTPDCSFSRFLHICLFSLGVDSESEQRIEGESVHGAMERFAADYPGFVPDLRATPAEIEQQLRRIDAWRREHPCPSTGKRIGACPSYFINRQPENMKWRADRPIKLNLPA